MKKAAERNVEKGMIGSQAGIWAMTGKDRKTPIIGGGGKRREKPQTAER